MTALTPYVRIVACGPGRARPLTQDEAAEAMRLILTGAADPAAVGALVMVLRYRGEVPAGIAGFAQGLRTVLPVLPWAADLDLPTFAAGRSRGFPWFLLAARLVAQACARVLLHGPGDAAAAGIATGSPFCRWSPCRPPRMTCCGCAPRWACGPASTPSFG